MSTFLDLFSAFLTFLVISSLFLAFLKQFLSFSLNIFWAHFFHWNAKFFGNLHLIMSLRQFLKGVYEMKYVLCTVVFRLARPENALWCFFFYIGTNFGKHMGTSDVAAPPFPDDVALCCIDKKSMLIANVFAISKTNQALSVHFL